MPRTVLVQCVCEGELINRFHYLTLCQCAVWALYAALLVYTSLALLETFRFDWLYFSIVWGSTALVIQIVHWILCIMYMKSVRIPGSNGTLVGTPTLREIQLATLISTFGLVLLFYIVLQFFVVRGSSDIDHVAEIPFLLLIAEVAILVMFYLFSAIVSQFWPLAVIERSALKKKL
jgi:hypothetical protein